MKEIVFNLLGSELFPEVWWILGTFIVLQTSLPSFFSNGSPMLTYLWYRTCVFTQEIASDSTQITAATWIRRLPKEWSTRTLSWQSQLLYSRLTRQTQIIQCWHQRKRATHMKPYVAFHQLASNDWTSYDWNIHCQLVHRFSHSLKGRLPRIWTQPLSEVVHAMPLQK
jgi:hypothetical protein